MPALVRWQGALRSHTQCAAPSAFRAQRAPLKLPRCAWYHLVQVHSHIGHYGSFRILHETLVEEARRGRAAAQAEVCVASSQWWTQAWNSEHFSNRKCALSRATRNAQPPRCVQCSVHHPPRSLHWPCCRYACCGGSQRAFATGFSKYTPYALLRAVDGGLRILWTVLPEPNTHRAWAPRLHSVHSAPRTDGAALCLCYRSVAGLEANFALDGTARHPRARPRSHDRVEGLDTLTRGTGGSSLLTAMAACRHVSVYGFGLLRLDPPAPTGGEGAPHDEAREAAAAAARPQLIYAHFYDRRVARCTTDPQILQSWAARKTCRKRECRELRERWRRDRVGSELLLHVLHVFGMITWRQ